MASFKGDFEGMARRRYQQGSLIERNGMWIGLGGKRFSKMASQNESWFGIHLGAGKTIRQNASPSVLSNRPFQKQVSTS